MYMNNEGDDVSSLLKREMVFPRCLESLLFTDFFFFYILVLQWAFERDKKSLNCILISLA